MGTISDSIEATQNEEDALRRDWALGAYMAEPCTNCHRQRVCICTNGKHRCEKCNWVPEDNDYAPITD